MIGHCLWHCFCTDFALPVLKNLSMDGIGKMDLSAQKILIATHSLGFAPRKSCLLKKAAVARIRGHKLTPLSLEGPDFDSPRPPPDAGELTRLSGVGRQTDPKRRDHYTFYKVTRPPDFKVINLSNRESSALEISGVAVDSLAVWRSSPGRGRKREDLFSFPAAFSPWFATARALGFP